MRLSSHREEVLLAQLLYDLRLLVILNPESFRGSGSLNMSKITPNGKTCLQRMASSEIQFVGLVGWWARSLAPLGVTNSKA